MNSRNLCILTDLKNTNKMSKVIIFTTTSHPQPKKKPKNKQKTNKRIWKLNYPKRIVLFFSVGLFIYFWRWWWWCFFVVVGCFGFFSINFIQQLLCNIFLKTTKNSPFRYITGLTVCSNVSPFPLVLRMTAKLHLFTTLSTKSSSRSTPKNLAILRTSAGPFWCKVV